MGNKNTALFLTSSSRARKGQLEKVLGQFPRQQEVVVYRVEMGVLLFLKQNQRKCSQPDRELVYMPLGILQVAKAMCALTLGWDSVESISFGFTLVI